MPLLQLLLGGLLWEQLPPDLLLVLEDPVGDLFGLGGAVQVPLELRREVGLDRVELRLLAEVGSCLLQLVGLLGVAGLAEGPEVRRVVGPSLAQRHDVVDVEALLQLVPTWRTGAPA